MLEIMRIKPSEGLSFDGPACNVDKVTLLETTAPAEPIKPATARGQQPEGDALPTPRPVVPAPVQVHLDLPFHWQKEIATAMVVPLPQPVGPGESVTVEVAFTMKLPQKQGRWGQWEGVTFLTNWLPVLAFYDDDKGWQPTPFVPWHQPWFNEAGVYTAHVTLPCDQKVACTGSVVAEQRPRRRPEAKSTSPSAPPAILP